MFSLFCLLIINTILIGISLSQFCWVCVIFFACVCVGASDMTTVSDDPSSSALCVVCAGNFPRGGRYAPPGYTQRSGQCPKIFLGGFFYF
jgi:hypothetical protein